MGRPAAMDDIRHEYIRLYQNVRQDRCQVTDMVGLHISNASPTS
jgi:hypothetical protein